MSDPKCPCGSDWPCGCPEAAKVYAEEKASKWFEKYENAAVALKRVEQDRDEWKRKAEQAEANLDEVVARGDNWRKSASRAEEQAHSIGLQNHELRKALSDIQKAICVKYCRVPEHHTFCTQSTDALALTPTQAEERVKALKKLADAAVLHKKYMDSVGAEMISDEECNLRRSVLDYLDATRKEE